ncbi:hypothetical protein [Natrinema pallidum]|uniref:hypothetical protein n=1 Tax=Natrinema pallidum TaxID=69527 RepID=UPI003752DD77
MLAEFIKVNTATLRYQQGSVTSTLRDALEEAGLEDVKAVKFHPVDDHLLIGEGLAHEVDGRAEPMARNVRHQGNDIRSVIPPKGIEQLGTDAEETQEREVQIDLWVSTDDDLEQPLIAITPHIRETMSVDVADIV